MVWRVGLEGSEGDREIMSLVRTKDKKSPWGLSLATSSRSEANTVNQEGSPNKTHLYQTGDRGDVKCAGRRQ